jgi:hypothetical protein
MHIGPTLKQLYRKDRPERKASLSMPGYGRIVIKMDTARSLASGLRISTRTTTGFLSGRKYALIPTIVLK